MPNQVKENKSEKKFKGEVLEIVYICLNACKQMTEVKLSLFYSNAWNHLPLCKK